MNRREEQIKELFQQLKQDDERYAPSFANQWETAVTRGEKAAGGWPVLRVAMAAMILMTFAGAGVLLFRLAASEQVAPPPDAPKVSVSPAPYTEPPPMIALSGNAPPKVVRRRRAPAQRLPLEAMISEWRSPTDFLLKTSEARWLKEVPRLGVPRVEIKPFVIEQNKEMEEL
jgi:hypothetical protein